MAVNSLSRCVSTCRATGAGRVLEQNALSELTRRFPGKNVPSLPLVPSTGNGAMMPAGLSATLLKALSPVALSCLVLPCLALPTAGELRLRLLAGCFDQGRDVAIPL
jgi:hypothetical protein